MCVCECVGVCVCVWLGSSRSFKQVSLNNKAKFCLYNFLKNLFTFSNTCLSFRLVLGDEFPKIVPNPFGPFIHKQATPYDGL